MIRKRAEEKQAPCYPVRPQQLKIKKITRKNIDFSFASRYDDVIPIEKPLGEGLAGQPGLYQSS